MLRKKTSWGIAISAFLLVLVALSGCTPPGGTGKATPTESVSGLGGKATPTVAPSATPAPTATPNPLAPPVPVKISPQPGAEIAAGTPIEITFSREIDPATAKAAVRVEPAVKGKIVVEGRTLKFEPETQLEPGGMYKLLISTDLKSKHGTPLSHPLYLFFQSRSNLRVSKVSPAPNSKTVDPKSPITIVFNKPIVPLTTLEENQKLPSPITIEPPVKGEGRWINTSVYRFVPSEMMDAGATYVVTVNPKLKDTTGGTLTKPVSWEFTIQKPFVKSFMPSDDMIGPNQVFTATFNVPMDEVSVRSHVELINDETQESVPGTITLSENITMTFKPSSPLEMGADYTLVVHKGAKTLSGRGAIERDQESDWSVYPAPAIDDTDPEDGEEGFSPLKPIKIYVEGNIDPEYVDEDVIVVKPKPKNLGVWYNDYDQAIVVFFEKKANTRYTITVKKDLRDAYGNTLGKDYTFSFTTGNYPPQATLLRPNKVSFYSAYAKPPKLPLRYRNVKTVHMKLYKLGKIAPKTLWEKESLASYGTLVKEWDQKVRFPGSGEYHVDFIPLTGADGSELKNGFYYVEMRFGESSRERDRMIFMLTPYNVVMKRSATTVMVWVTDLYTGEPVKNLPLQLYLGDQDTYMTGTTNEIGVWKVDLKEPQRPWKMMAVTVHPNSPDGFVISWNTGMEGWSFGFYGQYSIPDKHAVDIYTDRPIYRPNQTMHWKGIIRLDNDGRYSLPPVGTKVDLNIYDPSQNVVVSKTLKTNDMGTVSGSFDIPEKAPLGDYTIELSVGDESFDHDFLVAEYRKPQFHTEITTGKTDYVDGETLKAKMHAEYFFGGPLSNAKVEWRIVAHDAPFTWKCPVTQSCPDYQFEEQPWWIFEEEEDWDREIASGTGKTDANGNFLLSVPVKIPKAKVAQRLTVEFDVQGPNGMFSASRASVRVHKGAVYAGLAINSYVYESGSKVGVKFITVGNTGKILPNQKFRFNVIKEEWVNVKKESNGAVYWTSEVKETPVLTETITTGDDGKADYTFPVGGSGDYKLVATASDPSGHETQSSTEIWVYGGEYTPWPRSNNHKIQILPDKEQYRPGDLAKIMVMTPYRKPVRALVTVERSGILHTEVRTLYRNSEVITLRVQDDYVPNVFVSVVVVQGGKDDEEKIGSAYVGYTELKVSDVKKRLKISIKGSANKVAPRDTVTYTVEVRDSQGNPVDAELSVAVVDKAVLLLSTEGLHTLREAFYSERGLGFATTVSLFDQMEKLLIRESKEKKEALAEKGGGGGGGATVRHYFPDSAYWNPTLRTGKDGKVTFSFKVPDNLTTWQVKVKAIDADTRVGEAKTDLMVSKPFMVKPALTRFLTVGDEPTISAVIYNHTEKKLTGKLSLSVSGATIVGDASKAFELEPGKNLKLDWKLDKVIGEIDKESGKRVVSFLWKGKTDSGLQDNVRIKIPAYNYSTPETSMTSGVVGPDSKVMESVLLPDVSWLDPSQGELRLLMEPSLAAAMNDGLSYLKHYPYECIEQKVSRFLPNIFTYRALKENGLENEELRQQLGKSISSTLLQLYSLQHNDGGWGWWPSDSESSSYITAYALWGLISAKESGFPVSSRVMSRAARYIQLDLSRSFYRHDTYHRDKAAFEIFVISEYDRIGGRVSGVLGYAVNLYKYRSELGLESKALLAMAINELDGPEELVTELLNDIDGAAFISGSGISWHEKENDFWTMNTDVRTTAVILETMLRLRPKDRTLPMVVRWLMTVRDDGHWKTTQETAWSIIALSDWMRISGELHPAYSASVKLNGKNWWHKDVSDRDVKTTFELSKAVKDLLKENLVEMERKADINGQDKGMLYYTMALKAFVRADKVKPANRGFFVTREYTLLSNPKKPISSAHVGDIIDVKLTVVVPKEMDFVMLEDPIPAGTEPLNTRLRTTTSRATGVTQEDEDWWWIWEPDHVEMHDEKVSIFSSWMDSGSHEFHYQIRATIPGKYLVPPATASEMYFPDVFGRTSGTAFVVSP